MNMKKRGLGKGLSDLGLGALLGDLKTAPAVIHESTTETPPLMTAEKLAIEKTESVDGQLKKLPIHALKPGKYQPRKIMAPEALEELANSIRTQGVIQPVIVRPLPNHQYEIIAGERRWRAAQLAELNYIPAIIREINDESAMLLALIENIQRRDLNVIEEAFALNRMMTEFEMTHQMVADAIGKSRTTVTNILRLLKLNAHVRALIENEKIEMGHARALLSLSEENQTDIANRIVSQGLSVRETEALVQNSLNGKSELSFARAEKTVLHAVQSQLKQKLGVAVSVMQNEKGRGKLVIRYKNEKELENILSRIS